MALHGGRMINLCLCTLQWFSLGYVNCCNYEKSPERDYIVGI